MTEQASRSDILMRSGKYFDFKHPEKSEFTIEDIAHALSHLCRFTGHTRSFYSVAQHSVLVSYLVPEEHALAALLHDAAEAFIGDVAKPLKRLLPDYAQIERRVEAAVLGRFGLPPELPPCVKRADLAMLATEKRDLMPETADTWPAESVGRMVMPIVPWGTTTARKVFLDHYQQVAFPLLTWVQVGAPE